MSIFTCPVATPFIIGVGVVTGVAGVATGINGIAEIQEGFTGENFVRDDWFGGNQSAYNWYSFGTDAVATIGTIWVGGWMKYNQPRIQAYNNIQNYSYSQTISDTNHLARNYQSSTLTQQQVIKYGKMINEGNGVYKFLADGTVITGKYTLITAARIAHWKLVVNILEETLYHFSPFI